MCFDVFTIRAARLLVIGPCDDESDYSKRASSPTGHLCFICNRPATHKVRYTDGDRWICDTCTAPQQLRGGTASEGGGGGIFLALVGTGLHMLRNLFLGHPSYDHLEFSQEA